MKLSKHKRPTLPNMNMTPMIDIVFLLIIFFMTVSQASKINKERLELPKLSGEEEQKQATITINVNQAGQIIVSGEEVSLARLLTFVGDELNRLGGNPDRLTIVIRCDRRSKSRPVNEIVTALSRLEIKRVRTAVEVPQS